MLSARPTNLAAALRRLPRWAVVGPTLLVLAGLAGGAWWWWGRPSEPSLPPGPSDAALAAADPEVAATVRAARERALREPGSVEAWGLLGEVLLANGFPADADACLGRAEAMQPDEPRWPYLRAFCLLTTDRDGGLAALRRAVAAFDRTAGDDATPYLLIAELSIERDDRDQAEVLCRRVLGREPDNARAHFDMGLIALAGNDVEAGIGHLLRAADGPTFRQHAYTQLAAAYQRRGDEAAAADYARRARQTPPDPPGKDPYYEHVQGLAVGRALRYHRIEQLGSVGRWQEAAAMFRQLAAEDPSDHEAFLKLGILLSRNGELDEAERSLRRAADLAPSSVDPTYYLAVALYKQGERVEGADEGGAAEKFRAAADKARRATEIKPDHAQAHAFLGLALRRLGRRKEAIESFLAALRCRPEDAEFHLALGETLAEDGQKAKALTELQYACDLAGPEDARFRKALDRARAGPRPSSWLWP
jgi:tetratricopeptide (TPR) repeat protein